jgi:hypothetical protein
MVELPATSTAQVRTGVEHRSSTRPLELRLRAHLGCRGALPHRLRVSSTLSALRPPPPPSSPLADLADLPRLTTGCSALAACAATRTRVSSARSDGVRGGSEAWGNSLQCGGGAGLPNLRPHRPLHLVAGRCGGEQRFQARARGCLGRRQRDFGGPRSMEEASITSNLEEVGAMPFSRRSYKMPLRENLTNKGPSVCGLTIARRRRRSY